MNKLSVVEALDELSEIRKEESKSHIVVNRKTNDSLIKELIKSLRNEFINDTIYHSTYEITYAIKDFIKDYFIGITGNDTDDLHFSIRWISHKDNYVIFIFDYTFYKVSWNVLKEEHEDYYIYKIKDINIFVDDFESHNKVITEEDNDFNDDFEVSSNNNITNEVLTKLLKNKFVNDTLYSDNYSIKGAIREFIIEYLTEVFPNIVVDENGTNLLNSRWSSDTENYKDLTFDGMSILRVRWTRTRTVSIDRYGYNSYKYRIKDISASIIGEQFHDIKSAMNNIIDEKERKRNLENETLNKWNTKCQEIIDSGIISKEEFIQLLDYCKYSMWKSLPCLKN